MIIHPSLLCGKTKVAIAGTFGSWCRSRKTSGISLSLGRMEKGLFQSRSFEKGLESWYDMCPWKIAYRNWLDLLRSQNKKNSRVAKRGNGTLMDDSKVNKLSINLTKCRNTT